MHRRNDRWSIVLPSHHHALTSNSNNTHSCPIDSRIISLILIYLLICWNSNIALIQLWIKLSYLNLSPSCWIRRYNRYCLIHFVRECVASILSYCLPGTSSSARMIKRAVSNKLFPWFTWLWKPWKSVFEAYWDKTSWSCCRR